MSPTYGPSRGAAHQQRLRAMRSSRRGSSPRRALLQPTTGSSRAASTPSRAANRHRASCPHAATSASPRLRGCCAPWRPERARPRDRGPSRPIPRTDRPAPRRQRARRTPCNLNANELQRSYEHHVDALAAHPTRMPTTAATEPEAEALCDAAVPPTSAHASVRRHLQRRTRRRRRDAAARRRRCVCPWRSSRPLRSRGPRP
mmetsp:Transcript_49447/g.142202  ORF Transcript_49447/g.142202 Transcript_49447/m.142202 type:complete len:202 (+) Transcript_49447:3739-4344(+)